MIIKEGNLSFQGMNFPICLPASIISTLVKEGILSDINIQENAKDGLSYLDQDISFSFDFIVSENDLKKDFQYLNLSHVDTIADIYLNDLFLAHVENAHRTFTFDVKEKLKEGLNHLKINIHSNISYLKGKQKEYTLWGLGEPNVIEGYGHIRRCYCSFGWDWAPKLPDMGIDDVISLDFFDDKVIDIVTNQIHNQNHVDLILKCSFLGKKPSNYTLFDPKGQQISQGALLENNSIVITNPSLWWPRNMGLQPLYKLVISKGDFTKEIYLGLREVKLIKEQDELGESFYFLINKKPVFTLGANLTPTSLVLPYSRSKENSEKIIDECVFANLNSIRIWGGGIYPDDSLYLEADKKGILIFQDFMFSGTSIRLDDNFKNNVLLEVKEKVLSLINHPSLFLWCGNNECEFFLSIWKNNSFMTQNPNTKQMLEDNITLFEKLIPNVVKEISVGIPYIPSSQSKRGSYSLMDNDLVGDSHSWDVWAGHQDYETYFNHQSRFCDEFGFASLPSQKAFDKFSNDINSIRFHEVYGNGFEDVKEYISRYYSSNDDLVYYSQINQSDAICSMINHLRSNRPICMGSYYWCFNDIWPSIALSSLDYYFNRKALHYKLRRIQQPLQIVYDIKGDRLSFFLDNNSCFPEQVKISLKGQTVQLETLFELDDVISINETSNVKIAEYSIKTLKEKGIHFISYQINNEVVESVSLYRNKELLNRDFKTVVSINKNTLSIVSNSYLRNVMVFYKNKPIGDFQCFDIVNKNGVSIYFDDDTDIHLDEINIKVS